MFGQFYSEPPRLSASDHGIEGWPRNLRVNENNRPNLNIVVGACCYGSWSALELNKWPSTKERHNFVRQFHKDSF